MVIGKEGSGISSEAVFSEGYVAGYCLALDMTARDFQEEAKKKGHPWSIAKGFDTSCPVSDMLPMVGPGLLFRGLASSRKVREYITSWMCHVGKALILGDFIFVVTQSSLPNPHDIELWLKVNSEDRQRGSTRHMIFDIPTLVSAVSDYFTLQRGDVILTGTPSGVGPVKAGDLITAGIGDLVQFQFPVD